MTLMAMAALVLWPSAASAHAELSKARPEKGARLDGAPAKIVMDFTEPPTGDAQVTVSDGCGRDVVGAVDIQQLNITVGLDGGEPGKWKVGFAVVSGLDGHPTKGSYRFAVTGTPDCGSDPSPEDGTTDEEDGGSPVGVLLVLVGLGAFGGVVLAMVARR